MLQRLQQEYGKRPKADWTEQEWKLVAQSVWEEKDWGAGGRRQPNDQETTPLSAVGDIVATST